MEQATLFFQNLKEEESFPYLAIHNCLFLIHVFILSVIQGLSKLHLRTFLIGKYLLVVPKRMR